VSQENVGIVGRVLRRYSEGDVDGMLADVHSDVEIDYSESNAPDASVYHGHAACRSFVLGRYEDFEERSFDALELIDVPPNATIAV
jgi:ketosteroid isomerase-like protein